MSHVTYQKTENQVSKLLRQGVGEVKQGEVPHLRTKSLLLGFRALHQQSRQQTVGPPTAGPRHYLAMHRLFENIQKLTWERRGGVAHAPLLQNSFPRKKDSVHKRTSTHACFVPVWPSYHEQLLAAHEGGRRAASADVTIPRAQRGLTIRLSQCSIASMEF